MTSVKASMDAIKQLAPEAGFQPPTPDQEAVLFEDTDQGGSCENDPLPPGAMKSILVGLNNLIKGNMNVTELGHTKRWINTYLTPIKVPDEFSASNIHSIGAAVATPEQKEAKTEDQEGSHASRPPNLDEPDAVRKTKAYGAKAALEVNAVISRASEGTHQRQRTVQFEMASKIKPTGKFDWANKITLQVTDRDLPLLAALLEGHMDKLNLNFYGNNKNKSLQIIRKDDGLVISLNEAGQNRTMRLGPSDMFHLVLLVMTQLRYNYKAISDATISKTLAAVAAMHTFEKPATQKAAK